MPVALAVALHRPLPSRQKPLGPKAAAPDRRPLDAVAETVRGGERLSTHLVVMSAAELLAFAAAGGRIPRRLVLSVEQHRALAGELRGLEAERVPRGGFIKSARPR